MPSFSHADAAWLHMETPNNLMMITGLLFLDTTPKADWMKAMLEHRLCHYERFRMKVSEPKLKVGMPHWTTDPNFDVSNHLVYEELADTSQASLLKRCGELMSEPLDRERPLWEFRVFPGIEGGSAMVVRLHHCIADGIALMKVLLSLCDSNAEAPMPTAEDRPCHKEQKKGFFQKAKRLTSHLLHEGHDLLFHPSEAGKLASQSANVGKSLARVLALPPDTDNVFRGELHEKKLTAVSEPFALSDIKQIGKRFGCTVNDILMAILAGSLGKSLRRFQDVEEECLIRGVVPVDLRGGDIEQLGNRFGLVFLTLPVGEPDTRKRINSVQETMTKLKTSGEAFVTFELLNAVGMLPADIEKRIIEWFGNKATAVVVNLPGPKERQFMAGSTINSMMYWVPQSGRLALGCSVMSYAGQIRIGVTSDQSLIPEPHLIVEDFMTTLTEMQNLEAI